MQQDIDQFLTYLATQVSASPNTIAAYRNDLGQLLQFLEAAALHGAVPGLQSDGDGATPSWSGVTRTRIAAYTVGLREKGYAATTVARKIAAVKSFFHYLKAEGIAPADPTENLDSPRVEKSLPRSLASEEIQQLLRQPVGDASPEGLRDAGMLQLLWATGMRVSELVGLNVEDLDLSSGYVRCLGKNNRERIVPVTLDAQRALEAYLEAGRPAVVRRRDETALFVNHRGYRLTRQGFWLILKGYARAGGLPEDVTPQTLRHSFAFHQLDLHTDIRSLQELLGHASIATTQVYAHVALRRGRAPAPGDVTALA